MLLEDRSSLTKDYVMGKPAARWCTQSYRAFFKVASCKYLLGDLRLAFLFAAALGCSIYENP